MTMSTDSFSGRGSSKEEQSFMSNSTNLLCYTCGTQYDLHYDVNSASPLARCRICDDPRQYVPRSGQKWTSLAMESNQHRNIFEQDVKDPRIFYISTEPKLGIGNRCILLRTDAGNVLWDLIPYLDETTISLIQALGGLKAIVISHPHYYSTHMEWAKAFGCPVYMAAEDEIWLNRTDPGGVRHLMTASVLEILPGVTAIKVGGHFDGSIVLHWNDSLFIADSIMMVPSAHTPNPLPGTASFVFMWSYPNTIPLWPDAIHAIWKAIRPWRFRSVHGAFAGQDLQEETDLRIRVLESMKIFVEKSGHVKHALFDETI